jgi:hypothetical protein
VGATPPYPDPPNTQWDSCVPFNLPEDLENAIKERVKRLLNADVVDVTPIGADLDDVLGVAEVPEREIGPLGDELKDDGEADANPTT